jgi:hypothetical protein
VPTVHNPSWFLAWPIQWAGHNRADGPSTETGEASPHGVRVATAQPVVQLQLTGTLRHMKTAVKWHLRRDSEWCGAQSRVGEELSDDGGE